MRTRLFAVLALLAAVGAAPAGAAEPRFQIIVHPSNGTESITRREVMHLFLKKVTRWPDGAAVHPVEPPETSMTRAYFLSDVMGKSALAMKVFWNKRVYSGREVPPVEKRSEDDVIAFVRATPGAVGYVAAGSTPTGVKAVVLTD